MWQCDNCGYTDEDGTTFEEETEESLEDTVRYCPECGSDEVVLKNEHPALAIAVGGDDDDDLDDDWSEDDDDYPDDDEDE